jgi:hypothetical protein
MARESVLDYFWQEFAAIEWATDMALGDLFDVSLWTHKLCASLCDLHMISQAPRISEYDMNTVAANILGYVFNIYRCKMDQLNINLEIDQHWVNYETQRDSEILKSIKRLQEILIANKIMINEESNRLRQPYTLCRYRADIQSDQDLGYELSCVLQFIAIKTQLTLRQLAFLRLKIINPTLFERQRVEKIGLFKPADSSASSSETELEPPAKKPKNKKSMVMKSVSWRHKTYLL